MKYDKGTIVVEIAGRDSIAALIKYALIHPGSYFLPTVAMIPPEEDRYNEILDYMASLQRYIFEKGSFLYDTLFLDGEYAWWKINMDPHELTAKYGFFTYCIGCHGVVHTLRVPLARAYASKVITGERHRHDDNVKINQCPAVIDSYKEFFTLHGIEYITPVIDIISKEEIDSIMKEFEEKYMVKDMHWISCSLKGNAKGLDSSTLNLGTYLQEYIVPMLSDIVAEEEEWD
jgi:hypothetical protein